MLIKLTANVATLLLNPNPWRKKFKVQMQAELVDANNTDKIYIGLGFQPVATVGHSSQGEILIQSAAIERPLAGEPIEEFEKAAVWAVSDTDDQTLVVEEVVEVPVVKK